MYLSKVIFAIGLCVSIRYVSAHGDQPGEGEETAQDKFATFTLQALMTSVIHKVTADFENRLNATELKLERALTEIQGLKNENKILANGLSNLEIKFEKLNYQKPSKNTTGYTDRLEEPSIKNTTGSTDVLEGPATNATGSSNEPELNQTETNPPGECLVDVMFALDGSESIPPTNFEKVKRWVIAVAQRINASYPNVQFGVIQYSHYFIERGLEDQPYIRTEIRLGYHTDAEFERSVNDIPFMGFTTYTAAALRKIKNNFVNSRNFNKSGNAQVLILLTDGKAADRNYLTQSAQMLRDIDVIPFVVGVGGSVDVSEMKIIAGEDLRVLRSLDFSDLQKLNINLQRYISCDGSA